VRRSAEQIVITGAGLITPLGLSRELTWQAVLRGQCGMGPMPAMESVLPPGADGGQAPDLPEDFAPDLPREARYLRHTILQAMQDAGIAERLPCDPARAGIVLGTTLHGMRSAGQFLRASDPTFLKDFSAGSVLQNATQALPFSGPAFTTCSACSSSLGSIALAMTLLRAGGLDLVIAGGYDTISEYVYGGFNGLRLVSPGPLRPFARGRQGMKLAEGYGIVMLERLTNARRRGATPLAAVLGYGESADAHHLTQPHPQGEGAARAIEDALKSAGLQPSDIDLIAAHATGTPDNDAGEFAAFSRVFGEHLPRVPVVAFKSHLGHTLGGAGAVELILAAMAMREQVIPACANVRADDVEFAALNLSVKESRPIRIRATLNTSLGFGGANTCVILGQPSVQTDPPPEGGGALKSAASIGLASKTSRDVCITGIGVVLPGAIGNEAWARAVRMGSRTLTQDAGTIADSEILPLLNARRVRRMSDYVKLSLAAAVLCLRDAGMEEIQNLGGHWAAILGSMHGSPNFSEPYYRQIVNEGIGAANPMLFAEGVPNAAAAHLSLMLGMKGPCQTIIGSRTAGLDALRLAALRISTGNWDRALVAAAEEYSPVVNAAYGRWGLYGPGGFVAGAGAVTFLLESRASVEARGGRVWGRILGGAGATGHAGNSARAAQSVIRQLGSASLLIGSSNGTWIDRAESASIRHAPSIKFWSPYGSVAECYSVTPLAGLSAALLAGELPQFAAGRSNVIASDYAGAVSGVAVERSPAG
jgi:3-oxoacyl-[acyl-carrier-protein] synthase II